MNREKTHIDVYVHVCSWLACLLSPRLLEATC